MCGPHWKTTSLMLAEAELSRLHARFQSDGFAIVPRFLGRRVLQLLTAECDHLLSAGPDLDAEQGVVDTLASAAIADSHPARACREDFLQLRGGGLPAEVAAGYAAGVRWRILCCASCLPWWSGSVGGARDKGEG